MSAIKPSAGKRNSRGLAPFMSAPLPRGFGPAALSMAIALATGSNAFAHPSASVLERAWTDPRLHAARSHDRIDAETLARQYGLEDYLLERNGRATLPVTQCGNSGPGSLRDVIASAQSGDLIDLRGLTCSTITLGSGEIVVPQANLSILGNGPHLLTINSKYATNRIFNHTGAGNFILQGVTIAGGGQVGTAQAPNVTGGCIRSSGTVGLGNALFVTRSEFGARVEDCRIEANPGGNGLASGGGVFAQRVVMVNSVVSGSTAVAYSDGAGLRIDGGGGIATYRLAMLFSQVRDNTESGTKYGGGGAALFCAEDEPGIIIDSSFVGNSARRGGGLTLATATQLRNITVSENLTTDEGGGILSAGLCAEDIVIANSTITANRTATDAPGGGLTISGPAGGLALHSTIVQGNFRFTSVPDDIGGTVSPTGANNLVGFTQQAMPPGTLIGIDPQLGPLRNNGGRTPTHAIASTSQAIGTGSNIYAMTTDQRGAGFPRVIGSRADIGAFEYDPDRIFTHGLE